MNSPFGDLRLDRRLDRLTEELSAIPASKLPLALTNWASLKGGYRFVNNEHVTHEGIIEVEQQATRQRVEAATGEIIWRYRIRRRSASPGDRR